MWVVGSSGGVDDVGLVAQNHDFDFLNNALGHFVFPQRSGQVLPIQSEVPFLDGHVLVQCSHIRACVFIGSTELAHQVVSDGVVEFGDVAHILEPEGVEAVVGQSVLVELGHDKG